MALQNLTPTERAKRIKEMYERARSAKARIIEKMVELDRFDRGEQWTGNIPPWVPKPVTNYIHLVKTLQRANLSLPNHSALIRPRFPQDEDAVKGLQKAIDHEWRCTKARQIVRSSIETAVLLGTSIVQVYMDMSIIDAGGELYQGQLRLKEIDPANFFPDPNAYRLGYCRYVITTELVNLDWVKNDPRFIEYTMANGTYEAFLELKPSDTEFANSEIYYRPYKPDSQNGEVIMLYTYWDRYRLPNGDYQLDCTYVAGDVEVYRIENVKPNVFPFAILYDYPQRKSFWGMSTAELILENQKIINKVEQVASIIGTLLQNPQKIVLKESGINPTEVSQKGNLMGKVWVSNVDPRIAMITVPPPEIPAGLFTLAEQARQNIKEITGMNEAYLGESVGSLTTSTGVNSLIERATVRDRDKMVEIENFVHDIVDLMIQFMVHYYEEERWISIIGEDGSVTFDRFRGTDYRNIKYIIDIDVSGSMPTTKALLAQQARDLINMQGQFGFQPALITPEELLDMLDVRDKEKIKERMKQERMGMQAQQIVQLAHAMHQIMMQYPDIPPEQMEQLALQLVAQQEEMNKKGAGNVAQNNPVPSDAADMVAAGAMTRGR